MAKPRLGVFVLVMGCAVVSDVRAQEQEPDLAAYLVLLDRVVAAHEAVEAAAEDSRDALLVEAIERDTELLEWLDAFFASEPFEQLDPESRAALIAAHNRTLYLRSTAQVSLGRCEDALTSLAQLLDRIDIDLELRTRLRASYDEAIECVERGQTATLRIFSTPIDAEVLIDGEDRGPATASYAIPLGVHHVEIRAPGLVSQEFFVEAQHEDQLLVLEDVVLEEPVLSPEAEEEEPRHTGLHARTVFGLLGFVQGTEEIDKVVTAVYGPLLSIFLSLGVAVIPNLVLGADLYFDWTPDISVTIDDDDADASGTWTTFAVGGGLTYYIVPPNLYLGFSMAAGRGWGEGEATTQQGENLTIDIDTDWRLFTIILIGMEWSVQRHLDIGVALEAGGILAVEDDEGTTYEVIHVGLGFSATVH